MTPMIHRADMEARPLFNPLPGTIHVKDLVRMKDRKKNRLSDHLVGVIAMAIKIRVIFKVQADIFETVYFRPANIRKLRWHEGEPFLAPDGTVMKIGGEAFGGSSVGIPVGGFDIDNVHTHPNYDVWLSRLIFAGKGVDDTVSQAGSSDGEEEEEKEEEEDDYELVFGYLRLGMCRVM